MCCAAEIFGKKLLLLNAVDIYDSSMIHCDTNRSLFLLYNFFLCRLFFAQVEVVDEWLAQTANHVTEETMMK